MQVLRVHLLGEFRLFHGDQPVTTLNTARLQSLLAYLLLHRGTPQPRYHLAFQFWPDSSESQAHTNLRHLLHLLRRALPDADDWLCVDGATLLWRADVPCELDVVAFEGAVAGGRPQEAIDLYGGDLLPSCYDDWIVPERERLHQLLLHALEQVTAAAEEGQDYRAAIAHAQRLLRLDPLREETHRHLIRLHALAGDRIGVVRAYATCTTVLHRELDIEPTPETHEAYRRGLAMAAARHSTAGRPAAPPRTGPNTLPLALTRFIGREREKSEVERLVATHRLLTLTGAGGVGKTRLALAVASELCDVLADGVWHVDLAPLSDPALVVQTVAAALGVGEGAPPLLAQLIAHLQHKHTALILDNCERLVEAVRGLAEALLGAAPRLHLLVTSRVVLGAGGEVTWRVPSLPVPDLSRWTVPAGATSGSQAGDDEALAALCRNESVQIFSDRAAAVLPTFTVTAGNARAVGLVCQRLDGVPLALELAAARVKVLSVQQIASRLQDALHLLSSGSPGALPHQQTMRATMDWSHALLTAAEQALFRRLSVFVRGANFEAVEGIGCGEGISEADVLDLLSSVVDKSLVSVELAGEETRFRLHEVARQYAYARLVEAGEEARVRNRHLAFFCRLAEALEPDLLGKMPAGAAARMMREHDNLRAALEWSIQEGGDAQLGLRLAAALPGYWELAGLASKERDWLGRLLATAGEAAPPAVRARALRAAGKLAYYQCDFGEARSSFEQSLMLDRELDNKPAVADTLARLGFMFSVQQDYAAAEGVYRESLALSRALGDTSGVARLLSELGYTTFRKGDSTQARPLLEESLTLCRDPDDRYVEARARHFLGHLARFEGDLAWARSLYTRALTILYELRNSWGVFYSLEAFGYLATAGGQFERAARLFGAAEYLGEIIGTLMAPSERVEHERDVAAVAAALSEAAYEAERAKGRAMDQDEAIAYALEQSRPEQARP